MVVVDCTPSILYISTVLFDVIRTRRHGVLLPRWQLGSLPRYRGVLVVEERRDPEFGRTLRIARLIDMSRPTDDPPWLMDSVLLQANDSRLVLTGFERIEDGITKTDYAQTWILEPVHGS